MYEYLAWTILLGIIWAFSYFSNPKLRQKILWSSWIALPFGLGELYFIPNYWSPQTLFDLGAKYRLDIEAFALMFFLGGIAAFAYEGIFKKRIKTKQKMCNPCKCYTPLIAALVTFIVLTKTLPNWNIIYPASLSCLAGGCLAAIIYPHLRKHVIFGGLLFAFLYWASLAIIELLFTGWIASTWNMAALSGTTILKVPIEEVLFGFSFGTIWTPLFEEVCSNLKK